MDANFLLLIVFLFAPLLIARAANLLGSYRLPAMVTLLVLLWSAVVLWGVGYVIAPGDDFSANVSAAMLGVVVTLVVPLVVAGRLLARLIALRFAPSVADAIAAVIVGSTASFVTLVLSMYLSLTGFVVFSGVSSAALTSVEPLPLSVMAPVTGLLIFVTATSAWILMGWGSMPTLRQRKGTVIGLVCVGLAVFFSIVLSLLLSILATSFPLIASSGVVWLVLIGGAVSIIVGMLTAGFMHGILVGLASLFDLSALLVIVGLVMALAGSHTAVPAMTLSTAVKMLALIVALSLVQLRAVLIGQRVLSMLCLVLLAIPFVGLAQQLPPDSLHIAGLILLFLLLAFWLGRWGLALRQSRQGGRISTALLAMSLLAVPLVFLIA